MTFFTRQSTSHLVLAALGLALSTPSAWSFAPLSVSTLAPTAGSSATVLRIKTLDDWDNDDDDDDKSSGKKKDAKSKVKSLFKSAPEKTQYDGKVTSIFEGALSNQELETAVVDMLDARGFTSENTLLATSLCCDELARQLESDFVKVYGKNFNLGGLSGFPFAGNTGFGAMSAHIPGKQQASQKDHISHFPCC